MFLICSVFVLICSVWIFLSLSFYFVFCEGRGGGGDVSCFIRISVSTTTIIYAKQENQSFVCLQTLNIFECINMWEKVLCELSCDTKEETMSVYTRF